MLAVSLMQNSLTVEPPIKDPPKKGTTSLRRTFFWFPLVHFNLREEDNLSTEDKEADPKVSFIQRFHYIDLRPFAAANMASME